jgi:hypothetical protein
LIVRLWFKQGCTQHFKQYEEIIVFYRHRMHRSVVVKLMCCHQRDEKGLPGKQALQTERWFLYVTLPDKKDSIPFRFKRDGIFLWGSI